MSALTAARNTPMMGHGGLPITLSYPVAASTTIYAGGIVAINSSGYLVMASDTASTKVVGIAADVDGANVVNSGSNGDVNAPVLQGVARWANGNSITLASVGVKAYVSDDQTVATSGTTNSIEVGLIYLVDSQGVWVYTGLGLT